MDKSPIRRICSMGFMVLAAIIIIVLMPASTFQENPTINGTAIYSYTIIIEPIFAITASIFTIILGAIGLYEFAKKSHEERRWNDVVIK